MSVRCPAWCDREEAIHDPAWVPHVALHRHIVGVGQSWEVCIDAYVLLQGDNGIDTPQLVIDGGVHDGISDPADALQLGRAVVLGAQMLASIPAAARR